MRGANRTDRKSERSRKRSPSEIKIQFVHHATIMRSLPRLLLAGLVVSSSAFSFPQAPLRATRAHDRTMSTLPAVALVPRRPKHGVSRVVPVQMGLFGLGGPEIAVIAVITIFVLGPDKLKELAKEAGKLAPELKEVSVETASAFKDAAVEAAEDLKEAATPALSEFKEAAVPMLSDMKDVALKEAKDVAVSFNSGTKEAEVPGGTAAASADTSTPEAKPVQDQTQV